MDRAARMAALGINGLKRPSQIQDYLAEAKSLIRGTNLRIFTKLNSDGAVIHYTLKRVVDGHWTFLGNRPTAEGLYKLAVACSTSVTNEKAHA